MALCVNDSGTWREISTLCVNDSGTWREISTGCINDSGTWREFGMAAGVAAASLGDNIEGGYLICKSSGIGWIVAPASTEVRRTWYLRADAVTTAEANDACGDWFIPTCAQLKDPGRQCKTYWDSFTSCYYWSDTQAYSFNAISIPLHLAPPNYGAGSKAWSIFVRAFRCVSY